MSATENKYGSDNPESGGIVTERKRGNPASYRIVWREKPLWV